MGLCLGIFLMGRVMAGILSFLLENCGHMYPRSHGSLAGSEHKKYSTAVGIFDLYGSQQGGSQGIVHRRFAELPCVPYPRPNLIITVRMDVGGRG